MAKANTNRVAPVLLSLLRIVFAALYTEHGLQLLFGLFGGHRQPVTSFLGFGGLLEVVGGLLLLLGLYTRVVAFILCGQMAVAFFRVHLPHGPNPLRNDGELSVLYCVTFLYLIFAGGGTLSVDRAIGRS